MVLLEVRGVSKSFAGVRALDGVSLELMEGEILGVFGPNGAGKTTLFNVITGVLPPTQGDIYFKGRRIDGLRPWQVSRLGIARTFQIVRPFPNLTVHQNILLAVGHSHFSSLPSALGRYRQRGYTDKATSLLKAVGLEGYATTLAKNLTLGLRKRLEVARALATEPEALLLDEPLAGLSYEEALGLAQLILEIRAKGVAVMLVEHNVPLAMPLCQRAVVLDYGQKIAEGSPEEVRSNRRVIEAFLGEERVA